MTVQTVLQTGSGFACFRDFGRSFVRKGRDPLHRGLRHPAGAPEAQEETAAIARLGTPGDKAARKLLIEHNLRLVVYIAKKFDNTGVGVEDLISIGPSA